MWVLFVLPFFVVLYLVLLPVEKTLQITERVVSNSFGEFTLDLAFAGWLAALVVHNQLPGFCAAGWLRADVATFVVDFEQVTQK